MMKVIKWYTGLNLSHFGSEGYSFIFASLIFATCR